MKSVIEQAYREGFCHGSDHGNLPWKYPPSVVAWCESESRRMEGPITDEEQKLIDQWSEANHTEREDSGRWNLPEDFNRAGPVIPDSIPQELKAILYPLLSLAAQLPEQLQSDWHGSNHFELQDMTPDGDFWWLDLKEYFHDWAESPFETEAGKRLGLVMDIAVAARELLNKLKPNGTENDE